MTQTTDRQRGVGGEEEGKKQSKFLARQAFCYHQRETGATLSPQMQMQNPMEGYTSVISLPLPGGGMKNVSVLRHARTMHTHTLSLTQYIQYGSGSVSYYLAQQRQKQPHPWEPVTMPIPS